MHVLSNTQRLKSVLKIVFIEVKTSSSGSESYTRISIIIQSPVLWIRFILIRIRIRGSVSDDYGSGCGSGSVSGSWPNLDKQSKFRNFLVWKEKFCEFPLSIKERLKYSNPWTFRRKLAFSSLHLLKFCSKMNNFWEIWLLDPDPDRLKRIRIRPNETDPYGSGSTTLIQTNRKKGESIVYFSTLFCGYWWCLR